MRITGWTNGKWFNVTERRSANRRLIDRLEKLTDVYWHESNKFELQGFEKEAVLCANIADSIAETAFLIGLTEDFPHIVKAEDYDFNAEIAKQMSEKDNDSTAYEY